MAALHQERGTTRGTISSFHITVPATRADSIVGEISGPVAFGFDDDAEDEAGEYEVEGE